MKRLAVVAILMVAVVVGGPARAETPQERANRLSQQLMSPFCPGLTIHDCPSNESKELRAEIERLAAAGYSDDQIINRLESEYGPGLRAVPGDSKGVLVWVVPGAVLAAGLALAYVVSRRWSREGWSRSTSTSLESPSAEDQHRIEAEISTMRERYWKRL